MTPRRFAALLACVLIAAFALAACGGSSHHKTALKTTTSSSTITATASSTSSAAGAGYQCSVGVKPFPCNFGTPPKGARKPPKLTGVATVEQFDSIFVNAPRWALAVAGYANGNWPTFAGFVAAFPNLVKTHHVLSIAVSAGQPADCADMEPGNFGPSYAVSFYYLDRGAGIWRPCYYASEFGYMPQIEANLEAAGIPRADYRLWDADWTYSYHVDAGFDCTQYADRPLEGSLAGVNLDESACLTSFYQPVPPPPAKPWYAIFPNQVFHLSALSANEQATIRSYVSNKCEQPVRRAVCVDASAAITQLRNRVWTVAHLTKPTAWADSRHLGDRWHDLNLALANKTPISPRSFWLPKGYSASVTS